MSPSDPPQQNREPDAASRRGHLFIVSAPSGAGKSTLCQSVREQLTDLHYSISYTTRKMRPNEMDGVHYHFISETEFRDGIDNGRWAEWATVHNNFYGTAVLDLNHILDGGGDILLDIDVQGARQLIARYPRSVTIFILPPSLEILEKRLEDRGTDLKDAMDLRMKNAAIEIAAKDEYHHIIVNDDLDRAIAELEEIIRGYRES